MKNSRDIETEIIGFVVNSGNPDPGHWYVGITSNVKQRLFNEHNVNEYNDSGYIICQAINSEHARAAESNLFKLGFKGDTGGGDDTATFVYAYLITTNTR
jgi:hypothetical protein